jgi:hypothetical protein
MVDCECKHWATLDGAAQFLGNGHNPRCLHFVGGVGGMELLRDLVKGIRWWAAQEGGVPDELWEAYRKAVFITEGRFLPENQE